jgi:hypothetical protein
VRSGTKEIGLMLATFLIVFGHFFLMRKNNLNHRELGEVCMDTQRLMIANMSLRAP